MSFYGLLMLSAFVASLSYLAWLASDIQTANAIATAYMQSAGVIKIASILDIINSQSLNARQITYLASINNLRIENLNGTEVIAEGEAYAILR